MPALPAPVPETRAADVHEAEAVAELIAQAFEPLEMTRWLVPDDADRIPVMTGFLRLTVEHALTHGSVEVVGDLLGAAVWLPFPAPDIDDYDQRLRAACGAHTERFEALDTATRRGHPAFQRHDYLPFIAVRPEAQGTGLGGRLLAYHHTRLDERGVPSYLEAASRASARLYRRHGYRQCRLAFGPDGGQTRLYPMWRQPVNGLPTVGAPARRGGAIRVRQTGV